MVAGTGSAVRGDTRAAAAATEPQTGHKLYFFKTGIIVKMVIVIVKLVLSGFFLFLLVCMLVFLLCVGSCAKKVNIQYRESIGRVWWRARRAGWPSP